MQSQGSTSKGAPPPPTYVDIYPNDLPSTSIPVTGQISGTIAGAGPSNLQNTALNTLDEPVSATLVYISNMIDNRG